MSETSSTAERASILWSFARPYLPALLAALLLDEATAQVDGITEAAIQEAIAEVTRTRAVVTIAHRLSTVLDAGVGWYQWILLGRHPCRAHGVHGAVPGSGRRPAHRSTAGRMTPAFVPLWAEKSSQSGKDAKVIAGGGWEASAQPRMSRSSASCICASISATTAASSPAAMASAMALCSCTWSSGSK